MDTQLEQEITQILHKNWSPICHNILERFTTVSKSDLDAAVTVDDLVTRIAAKSDFPSDYVENQLTELCLVGAGAPMQTQQQQGGQQFGGNSGQRNRSTNSGSRRGGSRSRSRRSNAWSGSASGRAFGTYGS